jgi:hypothetical protein
MKEQPLSLTWNIISAEIIAWAKAYSGPVKPRVYIPFSGSLNEGVGRCCR